MSVDISITDRQRILDHAGSSPDEICGLLLGEGDRIVAVQSCANVSAAPATRFELDPAALIAAWRAARRGGPRVIGHYHSHPSGDPRPSATDAAEAAADGAIWIIVGDDVMTAWRAVEHGAVHGRFDPVAIAIVPDPSP
ncbi:Mov34/MPN/PAD-1 family protein [Sphingomonas sp. RHCKR47]|uniref:Mov34/MPN/PAD-1 family protein n=1 Tax=Sphingomonas citricola TaxID=2862498 RepID=UPI001CA585D3|nr:Mov34/MPN/PAD-1 family protein [Sphingomonas citricola]MBW6522319.1 Mov34/MPN/PAD-1 family protein [Sphingomonas citricola]